LRSSLRWACAIRSSPRTISSRPEAWASPRPPFSGAAGLSKAGSLRPTKARASWPSPSCASSTRQAWPLTGPPGRADAVVERPSLREPAASTTSALRGPISQVALALCSR
jgi:hypothetical protein